MPSKYQTHVEKWKNCERCPLCKHRSQIVPFGGEIPCDILFIGEAPGPSEDVLGEPFSGEAGDLLRTQTVKAIHSAGVQASNFTLGYTNLVICYPKDETGVKTFRPPTSKEIDSCHPRLQEIVQIAKPQMVVLVGKLAKKHIAGQAHFGGKYDPFSPLYRPAADPILFAEILHPGAILQADISQRGLLTQTLFAQLEDAFNQFVPF